MRQIYCKYQRKLKAFGAGCFQDKCYPCGENNGEGSLTCFWEIAIKLQNNDFLVQWGGILCQESFRPLCFVTKQDAFSTNCAVQLAISLLGRDESIANPQAHKWCLQSATKSALDLRTHWRGCGEDWKADPPEFKPNVENHDSTISRHKIELQIPTH